MASGGYVPTEDLEVEVSGVKPADIKHLSIEELKEQGNAAFKKAQILKKTTAAKQYLADAKNYYILAVQKISTAQATPENLRLVMVLHSNLAALYLIEDPPNYQAAKAACDIALEVDSKNVKALFRRAQGLLEDNREGLPEASLRAALVDLEAAVAVEPGNKQATDEARRISRRLEALEAKRQVPTPAEIMEKISPTLLDRGGDCMMHQGYVWGQTDSTVHIFFPARGVRITKSSEVTYEVRSKHLKIGMPGSDSSNRLEIDAPLHKIVVPDESSWQLEEGGLLLHVELAKRDTSEKSEHWTRVWEGHPATRQPSGKEKKDLHELAARAVREEAEEAPKEKHPGQDAILNRWKDICPGMNVEWGETNLNEYRQ